MSLLASQCDQFVTEYEPMLIEILVEVMEPSYVCSVSAERVFGGRQPGVLCGPWAEALGWGLRKQEVREPGSRPTTW